MGVKDMAEKMGIHDFNDRYRTVLKRLNKTDLSDENKNIILEYDKVRLLEGIAISTRIRGIEIYSVWHV